MHVEFRVAIEPRGQGRVRVASIGGFARAYKHKTDIEHESTLRALCAPFRPRDHLGALLLLDTPLAVSVVAVLPRPAGLCKLSVRTEKPLQDPARRWCVAKPDADNIAKAVLDALKDWWTDDKVVVDVRCVKVIAALYEAPHYEIVVETMDSNP